MNIVVLDGFTLNPGDLSWNALQSLGPCALYDRTAPADLPGRAAEADILLTNKTELAAGTIQSLPRLKYIGVLATGTNVVDLDAARARGIPVTNVPMYGTKSVAQMTFALLLELAQHVGHHAQTVREGRWTRNIDWCYWDSPLIELEGLTLGIVGFGRIGRAVAELGAAFGMKVLTCAREAAAAPHQSGIKPQFESPVDRGGDSLSLQVQASGTGDKLSPPRPTELAAALAPSLTRFVELDTLFRESDVVSLHCPLTPKTASLVNAQRLSLMKPTAFLLNTSRGPLVDEPALANALNSGRIAGAAVDVLSKEPPPADNPLLTARNCLITPHMAWGTRAARSRLMKIAVENVRAFLHGQAQNVVN